jgi:phage shock protein PspC (stress-responsive transcriptional regulator)
VRFWAIFIALCTAAAIIGGIVVWILLPPHHAATEAPRHIEEAN